MPRTPNRSTSRAPAAALQPAQLVMLVAALTISQIGCQHLGDWWHNDFKVGPNYGRPAAAVADDWIESGDARLSTEPVPAGNWWSALQDPELDHLIELAAQQNLPLRIAAMRILEARAQRGIAAARLFPQKQQMLGTYSRNALSGNAFPFGQFPIKRFYDDWLTGFDVAWELDIWGQLRRTIESADANVNAQIENYDDVLVILQADVAAAYIQMRTVERRQQLMRQNVELQRHTLDIINKRFEQGIVSELDVRQAKAVMEVTESALPKLAASRRTLANTLCLLVGLPPGQLAAELPATGRIPAAPKNVVVGIPADLLRRRPDVRRAERMAAAQCARIGMAEADFYPHFAVTGTIALNTEYFKHMFDGDSMMGKIGPGFRWDILHYGRLRHRVRVEDARFQQAVLGYQNAVLAANKEAEDAIITFMNEQARIASLSAAEKDTRRALELGLMLYQQGVVDYQRVLDAQRALVLRQDALAESRGVIAVSLVKIYKAMGGGWRVRLQTPALSTAAEPQEATDGAPAVPELDSGTVLTPEQLMQLAPPADAPHPAPKPATPADK